ncbi:MAG TPA: hypothetical protein VKQ30_10025 [Ktedonobacterales bacterium]|nr:hypothetical protein [Ktedonobacterales bacterium]
MSYVLLIAAIVMLVTGLLLYVAAWSQERRFIPRDPVKSRRALALVDAGTVLSFGSVFVAMVSLMLFAARLR